jgi:hypothetical protein
LSFVDAASRYLLRAGLGLLTPTDVHFGRAE